jgi:hypothetical protein
MSAEEPFEENGVKKAYRYEFIPESKDKIAVHVYLGEEEIDAKGKPYYVWSKKETVTNDLLAYGVRGRSANR